MARSVDSGRHVSIFWWRGPPAARKLASMTKPSLPALAAGLLLALGTTRAADSRDTAYTALRVMGKSLGQDAISRVVEVTGRGGTPQPEQWRIVVLDGTRGTREVKVAGGRVVSQKSAGPSAARAIRLQDLNLDSSGAFESADAEARKAKVPFTALDYALKVNPASGKPVWNLELYNQTGARVGGARLAAHDGTLIAVDGLKPNNVAATASRPRTTAPRPLVSSTDADHDTVRPTRVNPNGRNTTTTTTTTTYDTVRNPPTRNHDDDDDDERHDHDSSAPTEGGFFSRAGRTLDHTTESVGDTLNRTGHAVNRTVRRTGTKIQRFFTGTSSDQND